MRYKVFGDRTGLKVSEFALGTGMLGKAYGYGTEPDEALKILKGYAEAGGNLIDLSDAYQRGESERLIGTFVGKNRNDFVLVSKYTRSAQTNPSLGVLGNSRKVMVQAVEESLKRLKTDHIDIYLAHLDDGVTPIEEIVRGFDDLARAGKIVYGGLCNFAAWRVATAATVADLRGWLPIAAIELEYSLMERTTERELLPMAEAMGLGVLGYSPLAAGLLTGKYRKGERGRATEFKAGVPQAWADNEALLDVVFAVAAEVQSDPAKVAIAWVSAKGVIPIIGANTRSQLDANLGASLIRLDAEQIARLDKASAIPLGYPQERLGSEGVRAMLTGDRWTQIDRPARVVR
jgi:aryl-alcohol dehydrogenase-like predicted oxidoreductase